MECEFCGAEIAEGALACPRCGSPVMAPAAESRDAVPPLAKQEEDFMAMAEEAAARDLPPAPPPDVSGAAPGAAAPADIGPGLPPGAHAGRAVSLDTTLTGGYRGESGGGASVAGAGEQTADDPFGLRITEQAPPLPGDAGESRGRDWRSSWNMAVGVTAFLVAAAVCYVGIYYGFLKEKAPSGKAPAAVVENFCRQVISGNVSRLGKVSLPGSKFQSELASAVSRYESAGIVSVKEFEGETTRMSDSEATVVIRKLVLETITPAGKQPVDLLAESGAALRETVVLVNRDGNWLVSI